MDDSEKLKKLILELQVQWRKAKNDSYSYAACPPIENALNALGELYSTPEADEELYRRDKEIGRKLKEHIERERKESYPKECRLTYGNPTVEDLIEFKEKIAAKIYFDFKNTKLTNTALQAIKSTANGYLESIRRVTGYERIPNLYITSDFCGTVTLFWEGLE